MGTVLDDVTDDTIDAPHVLRRVDDWEARVEDLYAAVKDGIGGPAALGRSTTPTTAGCPA